MDRMKKFAKYVLWIILFYIFTMICTYVGFNATYKDIKSTQAIPNEVTIDIAQATKVNGRIYGKVTSTQENDLNGKYIKVQIYTKSGKLTGTKFLKIENANINEPKKFAVTFTSENIKYYTVDILDDSEEIEQQIVTLTDLYKDVFTDEELKTYTIVTLVLSLIFIW